ncbi:MAG TPA: hypothetical protein VFM46_07255 [Pseudomonadales bacterium]|nr:hypothetical protein [Pseudomonadales bacterium]
MQTAKALYFRLYVIFAVVTSGYALTQVMNTHQQGWLGVLLTTLPVTAFFLRLFTDKTPRTEGKLILLHILAGAGIAVTGISQPSTEQLIFCVCGAVTLLLYDFWVTPASTNPNNTA